MKRLLLGLMVLMTAGTASAEWTAMGSAGDDFIKYVDRVTIQRSGNFVKIWDLSDFKTVQKSAFAVGNSYFSSKTQREFDCKEKRFRALVLTWFDGQMGNGKVVYSSSETNVKWSPIESGSIGEAMFMIACGKK